MSQINIEDIIKKSGILEIMSNRFSSKLGIPEEKLNLYLQKKLENRLNEIGEEISKGDMTPEDFNKARRLSKMNIDEINDKTIKDK